MINQIKTNKVINEGIAEVNILIGLIFVIEDLFAIITTISIKTPRPEMPYPQMDASAG